jgi:hypothetical protein
MRIWFALLIAPVLALLDQAIAFALVGWACAHQTTLPLHATHALFLVLTVAAVVLAWRVKRQTELGRNDGDAQAPQRHFLAGIGVAVAVTMVAAVLAMWVATGVLAACVE